MLSPLQEISSQDQSFTFQPNPSYVCPSSLRYDRIHALRQRLIPLSPEQRDKSGNQLRIWELKGSTFLGTVITPDGRMIILPQEKIINPMSQGSSAPALQRIREMQSFPFRLVYLENRRKMFIWPHMVAAGKDWVQPQFPEKRSKLGHVFRREAGHFLHDTPQNRAYILEAVSHPSNYGGKTRWGTEYYFNMMPDGTQAWAEVRDGKIANGGINWIPKKWVENIAKRAGGELHPIQRLEYKPSTKGFTERLQSNKLTRTYNAVHRTNPVEEHPSESVLLMDIGGVGNKSGLITDLLGELRGVEGEHFFITPSKGLCLAPLEIQTILSELAEGIFVHDAIPWFSLHYNHNLQLYPVIHPVYQNTVIGHVVSMLDYYMKGFAYGRCYPMDFVREWNDHPVMDAHRLKKESFDFQAYCERHLGERSFTFDEAVEQITKEKPLSSEDEKLVLQDGFQVEYRIVAKQNAINKSGPLLSIGGDFDVLYSIIGDPSSKAQKALYIRLEKACCMMCKQIKEKLPLIPMLSQELDALKLINFFVYYFNTLKEAEKVPVFDRGFSSTDLRCCSSLFPPLNTNRVHEVVLNLVDLWRCIPKDEFLRIMKSSDVRWGENCLVGILKRYFSSLSHSRNLSDEQIRGLAHALLPVCQGRYATNFRAVNTVLSVIKRNATNLRKNASFEAIIGRIDELMKHADSKEKLELLGDKKTLQKWLSDPVDFLFQDATVVFNPTTKNVRLDRKTSKGEVGIAGGCGVDCENVTTRWDARCDRLLKKYSAEMKALKIEDVFVFSERGQCQQLFKLQWQEFLTDVDERKEAVAAFLRRPEDVLGMDQNVGDVFHAIATRNKKLFQQAAERIADWNVENPSKQTLVHCAAACQDPFFLNIIYEQTKWGDGKSVDWDKRDERGFLPQHYAAQTGGAECLRLLFQISPHSINALTKNHETPLYIAAQNDRYGCIDSFLGAGADPNICATNGMSSLTTAIHHGSNCFAILLLQKSTKLEIPKEALQLAVEMRLDGVVRRLIEKGSNPNQIGREGYRPLHLAVKLDWKDGVKILVKAFGIDLNATSAWEKSALDYAIECNHYDISEFLIENGAISKRGYWISWFRIWNTRSFFSRWMWGSELKGK